MVKSSLSVIAGIFLLSSFYPSYTKATRIVPIEKLFSREERQLSHEEFLQAIKKSTPSPDRAIPSDFECGWRPLGTYTVNFIIPIHSLYYIIRVR